MCGSYIIAIATGAQYRMTGNLVYDFFMGASLNPRIGSLDMKMFAEIRISWMLLFFLTTSCAAYAQGLRARAPLEQPRTPARARSTGRSGEAQLELRS